MTADRPRLAIRVPQIHAWPDEFDVASCCGRRARLLPPNDSLTTDAATVTCGRALAFIADRDLPVSPPSLTRPSVRAHRVTIAGPQHGRWYARCSVCDWDGGRGFTERPLAVDAADAHRIFTHWTGGYLCGVFGRCYGCEAVRRQRARSGLDVCPDWRPRATTRNVGPPAAEITMRPDLRGEGLA